MPALSPRTSASTRRADEILQCEGSTVSFTYDLSTDRGVVRLLIKDTDTVTVANQFYTDAEIDAFLTLNSDDVRYAAADALDTWASNEAMVTKAVTLLDISTNGPAVAAALRAHAKTLREQADLAAATGDAGFDIAEMALGPFSEREQILADALRDEE